MGRTARLFAIGGALLLYASGLWASTSAQLFGTYAGLFAVAPISKVQFEAVFKPMLQQDGFAVGHEPMPGITTWRMRDSSGTTEIVASPETDESGGAFNLKFTPAAPIRLGDSVIVALIAKSAAIEIEDGDVVVLTIGTRSLAKSQHTGTRSEYLKLNLPGGLWQETDVHIEWR
jgi:hypothetical protein